MKQRYLFAALFSAGVMMPIGFEFGFRKPLHVVKTTPADWENSKVDLRDFIAKANAIRKAHPAFQDERSTRILDSPNPNVLVMRKRSADHSQQALLILNKDAKHHQELFTENFRPFLQSEAKLRDVSPEYTLEHVQQPFHYNLRAGQGIVLISQ